MKGGGRKAIAGGAAPGYIEDFIRIMREDIKMTDREAWGEVSGPVETIIKKLNGNFVDASTAAKLLKGKDINTDPSTDRKSVV